LIPLLPWLLQVPGFVFAASACLLAQIYSGTVKTWNAQDLANLNG
jgi:hypothetical protein